MLSAGPDTIGEDVTRSVVVIAFGGFVGGGEVVWGLGGVLGE